jgi:hypothetical protein
MKLYLDTSVYNRPFDDQFQPRIWLETMSFFMILQLIETGQASLVVSSAVAFENSKNPFPERQMWVARCLKLSEQNLVLNSAIKERGLELEKQGIRPLDALHLTCAEYGRVEYFLTCDDKIIKHYKGKKVKAVNPVEFILKITEENNEDSCQQ